ncbi:MAG: hypothetical protein WC824_10195 [Bacteroidota bacterium]|jgi:hypothetical protein
MSQAVRPQEICIGISVEGAMLRLASVGRTGTKLNVLDLASMPLPVKQFSAGMSEEPSQKADNPFEDAGSAAGVEQEPGSSIDFSSIRDFIATHYLPNASFSLGLEIPYVRTFLLAVNKKDTPAKVRTRVVEEVGKLLNLVLPKRSVALEKAGERQVLAVARVEDSPMVDICTSPQGSQKRPPRLNIITSNQVALINLVRVHFRAEVDEIMHVIHVDDDVTHFFVMRGHEIEYIAPAIQQGAHDAHLVSTLYNRIELTAEGAGYLNPDKVVLSGKAEEIGLKEEILENNPEVIFHSLRRLRIGDSDDKDIQREMNNYLVPISLAWQTLQPKSEHFYRLDVLPSRIREDQKRFKLAWHGVLLLLLLFIVVTAMTVIGLQKQSEIATVSSALEFNKRQMEEQIVIVKRINELEERSQAIRTATTTLDTLLMNTEVWTETIDTLSKGAASLRDVWVSEVTMDKIGGLAIVGYAFKRSSIPTFSTAIGQTRLREITVQQIGETKVFRFDIHLKQDSSYPYSNSRAARWHDSVRSVIGDITPPPAAKPAQKKAAAGKKNPAATPDES